MCKIRAAKRVGFLGVGLLAATFLFAGGCRGKDEGVKHKNIEGKVTYIDAASDEVRMLWYNPKDKKDKEISGTLAPEAEILINGRTAKLSDVKIDDVVSVTGRIERHDGEPKLVAVKVLITRPTDTEPAETKAAETEVPATEPGA